MQTEDENALLARVAQGDRRAMQRLYLMHHDRLFAFLRGRGCDADTAADILHDTMLDVWRQAGRFRGTASVRTWIYTIARNKHVDRIRGAVRLTYLDEVPDTPDDSPGPEAVMASAQDAARVRRCLDGLKPAQREAIRLAYFEGLGYDDIAAIEGIPPGTVKSRVFHAKQLLLHCLGAP